MERIGSFFVMRTGEYDYQIIFMGSRGARGYTHAFRKTVSGSGSIPPNLGGGEADIHLSEDILGVAYGWIF